MSTNPPDGTPAEPEHVIPPEPVVPPSPASPPAPFDPPTPPASAPRPPQQQPAQPPQYGQPPQQPAQPPQYGQPPQQPAQPPQYGQPAQSPYGYAYAPVPPRSGLGEGAKIGIGSGIGCLTYVLAFFLFIGTMLSQLGNASYFVFFGLPVLVGAGLLFTRKTRGFGIGILIISAAAWLVVIGPCAAILFG